MFFADDVTQASRSPATVNSQLPIVEALFDDTLSAHPDWWCRRAPGDPLKPRQWQTFFIKFPYRDIEPLNREWQADTQGRFKKRRQLVWVAADELLAIYADTPDRLWKRVRQLENAAALIAVICQSKG